MNAQPLAILTLLSPAWLLGLGAAVGLPAIAHLLSRVRYRPVDFPAMRFVAQATRETTRINRPRHVLIMLLRILALCCVVFAFTGPRWETAKANTAIDEGQTRVILLDRSASMQRLQRGASYLDQAKRRAHEQLNQLDPAKDKAVIILMDRTLRSLLPEPSANFTLLRKRLEQVTCSYESADLAGAVALADAMVSAQTQPGHIVIISDGQASNRPQLALGALAPHASISEVRVGKEPGTTQANISIRLLDATPSPPVVGSPVMLRIALRNDSAEEQRITLHAQGGGDRASVSLALLPGASTTQPITLNVQGEGLLIFRVWCEIEDGFSLDDETGWVVRAASARRVLLLTDHDLEDDSSASRIALALAPDDAATARTEIVLQSPSQTPRSTGEGNDASTCWVIVGAQSFTQSRLAQMQSHLTAGGGVVWVADHAASRQALDALSFSPLRFDAGMASQATIASVRFDHAALSIFEGPARAGLVGQRLPGVAIAHATETAQVLMQSADGRPIMAMQRVGRGRLLVINADLSPGQGDIASQPAFVALINELVRYVAPGHALPAPRHPGDRLPDAVIDAPQLQSPSHAIAGENIDSPGLYLGRSAEGIPIAGTWAELDPAESDFTTAKQIASEPATARGGEGRDSSGRASIGWGHTIELWPMCIVAALVLIAVEAFALGHFAGRGVRP